MLELYLIFAMVVAVPHLAKGLVMFDPKQHEEKIRRRFEEMTPKQHADIYAMFYSAYLINEEGGYPVQAEFCRRQMQGLLSFNKIPEAERMAIEAKTCRVRAKTKHSLDEFLATHREQPNTTRH